MVNFPTHNHDCDSHSPALLDLFLSSDSSTCFTMAFPPFENSDIVSVSIDFLSNSNRMPLFITSFDYSHVDQDGFQDHLRDIPWVDIFKLDASAAATEFCDWVQVGIDVYIHHCKYQVKPHSSPWFSAVCAPVTVYGNHFFHLYKSGSSGLKGSSGMLVIAAKGFLKLPNLHMPIKQKSLAIPKNLALETFGKLLTVFLIKVNICYTSYIQ